MQKFEQRDMVTDLLHMLQQYCGMIHAVTAWPDLTLLRNLKLDWKLTFSIDTFNQQSCHLFSSFVTV